MPTTSVARTPAPEQWSPRRTALWAGLASVVVLAVAATVGVLVPGSGRAGPALLVLAGLVGLPHGAVDHLALGWARGRLGPAPWPLVLGYAAGAALVAVLALRAPVPAVLALLVLSAVHFAEGEVAFDRLRGGPGLRLPAAAVGTSVVALPLLLRPEAVRPLVSALDPALPDVLAGLRGPVLLATAALVVAALVSAGRAGVRRPAAELALVVAAALLGPPLLVFAAWFGAWHAPRHLVRLLALQPCGDLRERAGRLVHGAVLPTAAAVLGLAALTAAGHGLPTAVLVGLLALTVPHAAVVGALGDRLASARPSPRAQSRAVRVRARSVGGRAAPGP